MHYAYTLVDTTTNFGTTKLFSVLEIFVAKVSTFKNIDNPAIQTSMMATLWPSSPYQLLSSSGPSAEHREKLFQRSHNQKIHFRWLSMGIVLIIVFFITVLVWGTLDRDHITKEKDITKNISKPLISCSKPNTRREWRNLSSIEKTGYIEAIQCLKTRPSGLGLNQTLYDDFPWTHCRVGGYCEFPTNIRNKEMFNHTFLQST
jgi:magnesium-transporting ATPase (P-type)